MRNISKLSLVLGSAAMLCLATSSVATAATMYSLLRNDLKHTNINLLSQAVSDSSTRDAQATKYSLIDLGDLRPASINNLGQIVGNSKTEDGDRAFIWDSVQGVQYLDVLDSSADGKSYSYATGINNSGQVVGYSSTPDGDRSFIWDSTNGMQDLGVLGTAQNGTSYSRATGINNLGQVVGYSSTPNGNRAFIWDSTNGMQDLGVLPNTSNTVYKDSQANAINDLGQVVGYSSGSTYYGSTRAFIWDSTNGMQDLGLLNGYGSFKYVATSINNLGQVVGNTVVSPLDRNSPAFLWDSTNGMRALNFFGGYYDLATTINNQGQVVGYHQQRYRPSEALIWDNSTRNYTTLCFGSAASSTPPYPPCNGWNYNQLTAINDRGEIVGTGTYQGQTRGFILKSIMAVPEPSEQVNSQ